MCGPPAARAERIVALPNIRKIPVRGLPMPRTELREGGAKGTGEKGLFGVVVVVVTPNFFTVGGEGAQEGDEEGKAEK